MAGPSIGSILRKVKLPTVHTKKGPSIGPGGVIGTSPKVGGVGINTQTRKISVPGKEVNIGGVIVNRPPVSVGGNSGGIGGLLNKVKLPTAHTKFGAIGPGGFIGKFPGAAGVQTKITTSGIKAILPSRNINIGGLEFTTPGINEDISFKSIFEKDNSVFGDANPDELGLTGSNTIGKEQVTTSGGTVIKFTDEFTNNIKPSQLRSENKNIGKDETKRVTTKNEPIDKDFGEVDPSALSLTSATTIGQIQTTNQEPIVNNFGDADPDFLGLEGSTTRGQIGVTTDKKPIVKDFGDADPNSLLDTKGTIKKTDGQPTEREGFTFGDVDPDDLTTTEGILSSTAKNGTLKGVRSDGSFIESQNEPENVLVNTEGLISSEDGLGNVKGVRSDGSFIVDNFGNADPDKVFAETINRGHLTADLLDKVLSEAKHRDYARPTDFEVFIQPPTGVNFSSDFISRTLSFNAETATHVSETLDTIRNSYTEQLYAASRQMGGLTINFHVGADMKELKFFRAWMEAVMGTRSHKVAYRDSITTTMTIKQLDRANRVTYIDEFQDVYPTVVTEMALDYGSTNAILKLPVTFAYRVKRLNFKVEELPVQETGGSIPKNNSVLTQTISDSETELLPN